MELNKQLNEAHFYVIYAVFVIAGIRIHKQFATFLDRTQQKIQEEPRNTLNKSSATNLQMLRLAVVLMPADPDASAELNWLKEKRQLTTLKPTTTPEMTTDVTVTSWT
ncbi:hypothetical protein M3Y94_00937800 [Aphelenchoides besseyi]|nr:hypothetical protein M3Y94_00937800 [Aphelenchoides besseyi]